MHTSGAWREKLGLRHRTEYVRFAVEAGILGTCERARQTSATRGSTEREGGARPS